MKKSMFFVFTLMLSVVSLADDFESIEKSYKERKENLRDAYEKRLVRVIEDTVRRLEYLKTLKTRAGKLDEALKIKDRIEQLNNEKNSILSLENEKPEKQDYTYEGPESVSKSTDDMYKKQIRRRYIEFHKAILQKNFDKARTFIDPRIIKYADNTVVNGHFNILLGIMLQHKIDDEDVDTDEVIIGKKRKDAKVYGTFRGEDKKWYKHEKPGYWIKYRGEWYIGDEKELKNFKPRK